MKFMLAALAATVLTPTVSLASYVSTSLVDLAGTAERIVVGEIVTVGEDTVDVKVIDVIAGPGQANDTIVVEQFCNWACARRWTKYAVGQKVLLFLVRDAANPQGPLEIIGAGDEGESPVVGRDVYANFHVPGPELREEDAVYGYRNPVRLDQLRTAIRDFRQCYRVTPAADPWRKNGEYSEFVAFDRIERLAQAPTESGFRRRTVPGSKPRIIPFADRSPLHQFLADEVEREQEKIDKFAPQR